MVDDTPFAFHLVRIAVAVAIGNGSATGDAAATGTCFAVGNVATAATTGNGETGTFSVAVFLIVVINVGLAGTFRGLTVLQIVNKI